MGSSEMKPVKKVAKKGSVRRKIKPKAEPRKKNKVTAKEKTSQASKIPQRTAGATRAKAVKQTKLAKGGKNASERKKQTKGTVTTKAVKAPAKAARRPSAPKKLVKPKTEKLGRWEVERSVGVGKDGQPVQTVSYHTKLTAADAKKPTCWDDFCTETTEALMKTNKELPLHAEGGQWGFKQSDGVLFFTDKSGKVYAKSTNVIIAGSYDNNSNTWMWGWNNPSIRPELTMPAKKPVETYVQKNIFCCLYPTYFGLQLVPCLGEGEGWRFAAVVNRILGGVGVYRGPHGSQSTFFVMRSLIFS